MIDFMNKTYAPKEQQLSSELLPKGEYVAVVKSIGEWKSKQNDTLKVYEFDDKGRKAKLADGSDKFEILRDVTTYSAQIVFEITEGEHTGADVYYYLNLHPNQPWAFPAFLHACGVTEEVHPNDIKALCVGVPINLYLDIETRQVPVTDKVTGATKEVERTQNVVKRVKLFVPEV